MRTRRFDWRNERGAALALVAVSLTAILGMGALAVDLGMLMKARTDAQRTADAAALAGASAFIDENVALNQADSARARALDYASRNYVGATTVDVDSSNGGGTTITGTRWVVETKEAVIVVIPDSFKVRAIIRRQNIGTFFGRIMGQSLASVSAKAAAEAVNSNGTKCVKPFALPDMWQDMDDDTDGDRLWDPNESWEYDPNVDVYKPYEGDPVQYGNINDTGYGSEWRDESPDGAGYTYEGDKGRQINIKPQNPNDSGIIYPGIFYPWVMPEDPTQESGTCGIGGGGEQGAAAYSQNICTCNNSTVLLGVDYEIKTGNMVGPSFFGIQDLIDLDPKAEWDPFTNSVVNSKAQNWLDSPRVIKIALWDPIEVQKSGKTSIKFTNIALMFVEKQKKMHDPITARFITYAQGSATTGPGGPLIKTLRLIE